MYCKPYLWLLFLGAEVAHATFCDTSIQDTSIFTINCHWNTMASNSEIINIESPSPMNRGKRQSFLIRNIPAGLANFCICELFSRKGLIGRK